MDSLDTFSSYRVEKDESGTVNASVCQLSLDSLPPGELLVRVAFSSLNYKDALSATAHPGISPNLPHVPGIDAVGQVVSCETDQFSAGDWVIISGHEFGSIRWGGWSEFCRVPAEWAVLLPAELQPREAILLGTAGFTAAQCVKALLDQGLEPGTGPVVVTGATGGVGTTSIMLLKQLGFEVIAVTGKASAEAFLLQCGASRVESRQAWSAPDDKPMLKRNCIGGVDSVGGPVLSTLLRSTEYNGVVAACGLAASPKLEMTVYPFILRGVRLIGIDSAWCSRETRLDIWRRLAEEWRLNSLESLAVDLGLDELSGQVEKMLAGETQGRTVVTISN